MCGIAGIIYKNLSEQDIKLNVSKMISRIIHRGPDSNGHWIDKNNRIILCSTRLAIQDLSKNGEQPMSSKSERYKIVFNGEIYNFKDLKNEYLQNIDFIGNSDTEVFLELIEKFGIHKTLSLLDGMFAFALWDKLNQKLYLCRDRFGEKPLYYGKVSGNFVFASELNSISSLNFFNKSISKKSIDLFLKYSFVPAPYSIFEDIYKLEPAKLLTFNIKSSEIQKSEYWSAIKNHNVNATKKLTEKESIQELDNVLNNTISNQIISDAPIGAFLSSGVDSGLISAIMSNQSKRKINTFTVGFDEDYDETLDARKISKIIGSEHHEINIKKSSLLDTAKSISKYYDEPFSDSSQIPTYFISKFASKKVKVILSGDGADELFGGYNRYLLSKKYYKYLKLIPQNIKKYLQNFIFTNKYIISKITDQNNGLLGRKVNINSKTLDKMKQILLSKDFLEYYDRCVSTVYYPDKFDMSRKHLEKCNEELPNQDPLIKMMLLDIIFFLPSDMLCKVDRASMANSLEVRCPYLSKNVYDLSCAIPQNQKVDQNYNSKVILKQLIKKYIPGIDYNKKKKGFGVPIEKWLRSDLLNEVEETFNDKNISKDLEIDKFNLHKLWTDFKLSKNNYSDKIWSFYVLFNWYENFRNRD